MASGVGLVFMAFIVLGSFLIPIAMLVLLALTYHKTSRIERLLQDLQTVNQAERAED